MVNELARRLRDMVEDHLAEQKGKDPQGAAKGEYTQEKLARHLQLDPGTVSKYLNGKLLPSTSFTRRLVGHIHKHDPVEVVRLEKELDKLRRVRSKISTIEFREYRPSVVAFDFPPFLRDKGKSGFVYTIFKRLFDLANQPLEASDIKPASLSEAINSVSDAASDNSIVLGAAETIPRSITLHTFHTPATVTLNIVAPMHGIAKPSPKVDVHELNQDELDRIREEFLAQKRVNARFLAVRDEFAYTHLVEVLKIPADSTEMMVVMESFDPPHIAAKLRSLEKTTGPCLFVADELTCLEVARELNTKHKDPKDPMAVQYGVLFPLATLAVTHCYEFSKIPTYKVGLFSVARQLTKVIEVLEKSLNTMFNNERFFVAFEYRKLVDELTSQLGACLEKLPPTAKQYLAESHSRAQEHFQFPWRSSEFNKALAARVARQMLRLNTQLIESEDDLNLRWKPILEQVREQLGPLRPEYRDLRFDQGSVRCRVFPPFIVNEPKAEPGTFSDSGSVGEKTEAALERISDWSIFGPVLSEVADMLNFEDMIISADSDETSRPCDFTMGMFDVVRRSMDMHFFRFPVHLRMNALYLGEHDEPRHARSFFSANAALQRATMSEREKAASQLRVIPIVLRYTGAHYLCWDWNTPKIEFIDYDPRHAPFDLLPELFEKKFIELAHEYKVDQARQRRAKPAAPMILSDELTCLKLLRRAQEYAPEMRLLFEDINDEQHEQRSSFYYSVAVQRSEGDRWWKITQEVFPSAIAKSQRQLVLAISKLESQLQEIAQCAFSGKDKSKEAAKWARRVLCEDFVRGGHGKWNSNLLHEAWQPVLSEAFSESQPRPI